MQSDSNDRGKGGKERLCEILTIRILLISCERQIGVQGEVQREERINVSASLHRQATSPKLVINKEM